MIYPSIDKLLTIVDSKYALVYVAAERSKQMIKTGYYQKPINITFIRIIRLCAFLIAILIPAYYDNLIHVNKQ
mgnify:CR=1 FL=1